MYYFGPDGIASTDAPEVVSSEAANAIDEEPQEAEAAEKHRKVLW